MRYTEGVQNVKLVAENEKLQGADLIEEINLEEICEKVVLN